MKKISAAEIIVTIQTIVDAYDKTEAMLGKLLANECELCETLTNVGSIDAELTLLDFVCAHRESFDAVKEKLEYLKEVYK